MREIRVSTDVFARIWALREAGEETESEILDRVLSDRSGKHESGLRSDHHPSLVTANAGKNKIKWRDDVIAALEDLGGEGYLPEIYNAVIARRSEGRRSIPASVTAIIRRELEYNSSDSESHQKRFDLFRSVNGIGGGRWALR